MLVLTVLAGLTPQQQHNITPQAFCDESLTCFEPEAEGHLVQGLPFHK